MKLLLTFMRNNYHLKQETGDKHNAVVLGRNLQTCLIAIQPTRTKKCFFQQGNINTRVPSSNLNATNQPFIYYETQCYVSWFITGTSLQLYDHENTITSNNFQPWIITINSCLQTNSTQWYCVHVHTDSCYSNIACLKCSVYIYFCDPNLSTHKVP
jgi:hypothetical protein